jgi:hypothetical protein
MKSEEITRKLFEALWISQSIEDDYLRTQIEERIFTVIEKINLPLCISQEA